MDLSVLKNRSALALGGLLALTFGAGTMQATNNSLISVSAVSGAVTCNISSGPGASQTFTVTPAVAMSGVTETITVLPVLPANSNLTISPSTVQTLTNPATNPVHSITFTLTASTAAPCTNFASGTKTISFTTAGTVPTVASGTDNATATVTETLVTPPSPLTPSVTTVALTCLKTGPTSYTASSTQTISVTAASSQAFTVAAASGSIPAWATIGTPSGSASSTPATFTIAPTCTGLAAGFSSSVTLNLLATSTVDLPAIVTVSITVAIATPLSAMTQVNLTYQIGSGTATHQDILVKSTTSPSPYFTLDPTTLPSWLTADSTSGTATTAGYDIRLSTTSICDSMVPGTYTATLHFKVSGAFDQTLVVSMFLNGKAPTLSVPSTQGTARNYSWTLGTAVPSYFVTVVSSDSPIPYTATTGGLLFAVGTTPQDGLAYSFGTNISFPFSPAVFAAAQPGQVLTGTVTIVSGTTPPSTIVVTFNITVLAPGATISGLSPSTLPANPGAAPFTVIVNGTGFINGNTAQKTRVGFVSNGTLTQDSAISVTWVSATQLALTIQAPANDANLNFATTTSALSYLGVCNPTGANPCPAASNPQTLTISAGPIIQAVTSASTFAQVNPPAYPSFAPYDMISIFGSGFCPICATGQIMANVPDAVTLRFPTSLTPDSGAHTLSVFFYPHGTSTTPIGGAPAPLLFGTSGQINLLVPGEVTPGTVVDMQLSYVAASGIPTTSARFPINITATDPGIFTVGSDGQGNGAILDKNYNLITAANPAGIRTGTATPGDSDTIQLYVTGLGSPDTSASWNSTNCDTASAFETALSTASGVSVTSLDGAVMQSTILNGLYAPCIASTDTTILPSVTIGGVSAVVNYAGFVADTVAGLYQINVLLPSSIAPIVNSAQTYFVPQSGVTNEVAAVTAPMQLPIVITTGTNGTTSQQGVTLWLAPRLNVTAPPFTTCVSTPALCAVGITYPTSGSQNQIVATEGTSPYHYAVTTGSLPTGLTIDATGHVVGIPVANTNGSYPITVTVSDSANVPLTGTVSFTLNVADALLMTANSSAVTASTYATANVNAGPVITPTGGTFPYTFAISSANPPIGMTLVPTGCTDGTSPCDNGSAVSVQTSASTPAGTYIMNITATDAAGITGTIHNITVVVGVKLTETTPVAQAAGSGATLITVTGATGNISGTPVYTLNEMTPSGLVIDQNGNVTTGTATDNSGSPQTYSFTVTVTDSVTEPTGSTTFGTATSGTITVTVN